MIPPGWTLRGATGIALLAAAVFVLVLGIYSWLVQIQGGAGSSTSPTAFVQLLLGSLALAAVLAALAPWRGVRLALLSGISAAGLVLGALAVFSIGLLVLVGACLALGAYILNLAQLDAGLQLRRTGLMTIAGGLLGLVAVGVAFVPSMFPHVECHPRGASFSSGWGVFGGGGGGGTMSGSADGTTVTGTGFANGRSYSFTCRDGKLEEFTQR